MSTKPDLPSATRSRAARGCVACGSMEHALLYRNEMARIAGLDLSYDVAQCARCDAAYADALAAPADYAAYYEQCSKYDSFGCAADISTLDRRRAEFAGQFVGENVPVRNRVLDLGCGSGVLLAQLRSGGARHLSGIDPAPNAPASALRLFGLDGVRQGSITDVDRYFMLEDFDLVCMTAVLEHLTSPLETLRRMASRMAAGAALLIEVPALEGFARTPLEPYGELSIEHINYFSQRSLVEMASRAGLRPIAAAILDLRPLGADSLFMLLRRDAPSAARSGPHAALPAGSGWMRAYLEESARALEPVLSRAAGAARGGAAVLWGAGSHSARLLPKLEKTGASGGVRAIVDSNPNLHGRTFGRHVVLPTETLAQWPESTVIVSSFRSSAAIAARLKAHFPNPICALYGS